MTAPAGPPPFIDPANPLVAQVPARWDAGTLELSGGTGKVGVLTFRTASTTLTLLLNGDDAEKLASFVTAFAATVRGSSLAIPTIAETHLLGRVNGKPPAG